MTVNDIRNSIAEQLEEGRAKAMAAVCFMIFFIFEDFYPNIVTFYHIAELEC